jgi:hypothetical protein
MACGVKITMNEKVGAKVETRNSVRAAEETKEKRDLGRIASTLANLTVC